jgi:hypothetical protein
VSTEQARAAKRETDAPAVGWAPRLMLIVFVFVAFECALLAVAMKGAWFIMLAPAGICAYKAVRVWREITRQLARK